MFEIRRRCIRRPHFSILHKVPEQSGWCFETNDSERGRNTRQEQKVPHSRWPSPNVTIIVTRGVMCDTRVLLPAISGGDVAWTRIYWVCIYPYDASHKTR